MAEPTPAPPRRREDIEARELPDGSWLLFDPAAGASHAINASAGLIWSLSDGQHSAAAICDAVLAHYDADPATVRRDVAHLLAEFGRLGLLAEGAADEPRTSAGTPEP